MGTNGTPLKGLPADMITDLMGKSRTRNQYGPKLVEFDASDEAGVNPAEAWPLDFGNKSAGTLYQGFRTAIEKNGLADMISLRKQDDAVFLLHNERVRILRESLLDEANNAE